MKRFDGTGVAPGCHFFDEQSLAEVEEALVCIGKVEWRVCHRQEGVLHADM